MDVPNGRDPDIMEKVKGQMADGKELNILERMKAPTPKFFKKLRAIGLILAAAGGALVTAPVMLPTIVVTIGGYMIVAGSVASAVSQATICGEAEQSTLHHLKKQGE
jgi:hypothetical protein